MEGAGIIVILVIMILLLFVEVLTDVLIIIMGILRRTLLRVIKHPRMVSGWFAYLQNKHVPESVPARGTFLHTGWD